MKKLFHLLFALALPLQAFCAGAAPADELKLMTFNIRYGRAADGPDSWEFRKELVVETIKKFDPDILGLQEALDFQIQYLTENLTQYAWVGVGREDGRNKGEFSPVFFKRKRFEVLAWSCFWLSETPHLPGSKGWDAALPRIVTWVRLGLTDGSGRVIYVFNTHFDHRGQAARLQSARLLRRRLDVIGPGRTIVVLGDFNASKGSQPYRALLNPPESLFPKARLVDAYALLHPEEPPAGEGTFHGFSGKASRGRIDWVVLSDDAEVKTASILRDNRAGRYPSDHFPVAVLCTLKAQER